MDWLLSAGFRTPPAWVILPGLVDGLEGIVDPAKRYAVRSSANVEDGSTASFAGQFLTVLDVSGLDEIRDAIERVRASTRHEAVRAYAARLGQQRLITMPVIVQEMVAPVASGVVFTRNPITGLNEVVLEAVAGRGDRLASEGVTPHRWVRRWGEWVNAPPESPLPDVVAVELTTTATDIAAAYGSPIDLEWVWDGTDVWWVQIRPITGIENVAVYSNRISKEVMPGLIKPLVWSVNVPVVNRAWIELFTEAIGENDLEPDDLAKSFAYRSYFNMGAIGDVFELMGMPRDSLELLLGLPPGPEQPRFKPSRRTMLMTPRLLAFAVRKARFGRRALDRLPEMRAGFARYDVDLRSKSDAELLAAVEGLMEATTAAAYANIVIPLLANLFTALLRKRLARRDLDLAEIDISGPDEHAPDVDPNPHLDRLTRLIDDRGRDSPEVTAELRAFLEHFGHFSDSGNDFSVAPWSERPDLVLQMIEARPAVAPGRMTAWAEASAKLGAVTRLTLNPLRKRAATHQQRREQVSSLYTYGYGLFRKYFLELGRRLEEQRIVAAADDVMYLTLQQVRDAVSGTLQSEPAQQAVAFHKAELQRVADIDMPEVIYGDDFIPAGPSSPEGTLHGVATSRGHHRGPVRVVTGIADFARVEQGDVLTIPYSDVGWTPLFAKAGAVIAESGGMLSHSSIVAREYGIPCVVSVAGATRLEDGAMVTVDGYRGEVVVD